MASANKNAIGFALAFSMTPYLTYFHSVQDELSLQIILPCINVCTELPVENRFITNSDLNTQLDIFGHIQIINLPSTIYQ